MKYQIGDKIIINHTNEEGKIVEIINEKMALIEVRGVQFPAYMDQIDFPYYKQFTQKSKQPSPPPKVYIDQIPKEKKQTTAAPAVAKPNLGLHLYFYPQYQTDFYGSEVVDAFKIYLVNKNNEAYHFQFDVAFFGKSEFSLKQTINPQTEFYIYDIPFTDLSDSPEMVTNISQVEFVKGKAKQFTENIKLKGKQIFKQLQAMQETEQTAITKQLFLNYPEAETNTPPPLPSKLLNKIKDIEYKKWQNDVAGMSDEIDLHIEKLTGNWGKLSPYEILQLQLQTLEKKLDQVKLYKMPYLAIIHGVGTGRLKDEVHQVLNTMPFVSYFINQFNPKYGYGATEVFFK
jgi:hypothetical protein